MAGIYKVQIEDESGNIHYPHTTADIVFMADGKNAEQTIKDLNEKKHIHSNKTVIDKITQALLDNWSAAYTHISDAVKHITAAERASWNTVTNKVDKVSGKQLSTNDYTAAEKTKLAGIAAGANNYVHPTTTGNKHIPTGGVSGQFLKWSADGTAVWAADNNTTYAAFKAATASAAGGVGLVPAPAAGAQAKYLRADGSWQTPPNTTYNAATQSTNGLMAADDKKKLDGVAAGANNYVHPSSHSASMITQDSTHRFTTDAEKSKWNEIDEVKQSLEKYASLTVTGELLNLPGGGDIAVTGEILTIPLRI